MGDPQVVAGKPVKKIRRFCTCGSGSHFPTDHARIQVTISEFREYLRVPAGVRGTPISNLFNFIFSISFHLSVIHPLIILPSLFHLRLTVNYFLLKCSLHRTTFHTSYSISIAFPHISTVLFCPAYPFLFLSFLPSLVSVVHRQAIIVQMAHNYS